MPSAHGPTFCRKQLRENIGLIQRTQPDFSSQTKNWTLTLRFFIGVSCGAHGRISI